MRTVSLIIVHCSANKAGSALRTEDIDRYHRSLGWKCCGYHYVIPTDGMIEAVYYKSGTTLPFAEELNASDCFLIGKSNDNIALEYGLKFHIDWLNGQKTGFFLDQKYNRLAIQRLCKDAKVLDCFTHTG